jgi:tetratricopeptide (TPR) repeat protein
MMDENGMASGNKLLDLPIDDLFKETKNAVQKKDHLELKDIDVLVTRFFCKKVVRQKYDELIDYNKLMVNFLSWFEWGGKKKWEEAGEIVKKWQTILELSQLITQAESPQKAYRELKKSSRGEELVELLMERKLLKPSEIQRALEIKSKQQVSKMLSRFENAGIIVREVDGKNVWVSLGIQGTAVYKEYIEPRKLDMMQLIFETLYLYENNELDKAKEELQRVMKREPRNSLVICLLGIVTLEEGNLFEAGKLFSRAVKIGLNKKSTFLVFSILKEKRRLKHLMDEMWAMNLQGDQISEEIKPALYLYGMVNEYMGNKSRANEYYRLVYQV